MSQTLPLNAHHPVVAAWSRDLGTPAAQLWHDYRTECRRSGYHPTLTDFVDFCTDIEMSGDVPVGFFETIHQDWSLRA